MGKPSEDKIRQFARDAFDAVTKEIGVSCSSKDKRRVCELVATGLIDSIDNVESLSTMPEERRDLVLSMAASNSIRKHIYKQRPDLAPS